jgi:hypothetical protein
MRTLASSHVCLLAGRLREWRRVSTRRCSFSHICTRRGLFSLHCRLLHTSSTPSQKLLSRTRHNLHSSSGSVITCALSRMRRVITLNGCGRTRLQLRANCSCCRQWGGALQRVRICECRDGRDSCEVIRVDFPVIACTLCTRQSSKCANKQ